jgi:hypothetical protein
MSQAVASFVTKLITHFPVKHESQFAEQEWMGSMVRNLRTYPASVLDRGAQKLIDTRTDRRFPLPSECKKVCDEIASRDHQERQASQLTPDAKLPPQFSEWRVKLADDLIMCPMGREAAKEGWILALHDFARDNGRLPVGGEISKTKAVRKGFDDAYYDVISGNGGFCAPALKALGDKMIARRNELTERLLGKKVA